MVCQSTRPGRKIDGVSIEKISIAKDGYRIEFQLFFLWYVGTAFAVFVDFMREA